MTTTTYDEPQPSMLDRSVGEVLALTWEKVLYGILLLAGFVTRFYDLGARVMSHDESLHTQFAWYLANGRGYVHSPLMHGVLRFEATAFTYWLLGDNDFTARIPTALMGVLAIGLMWFFRKWLGRVGAFLAAVMLLISPYMLYYSRYIRDEPYMVVWGILTTLMIFKYMEEQQAKYLYILSVVSVFFYTTMEASFIYIAIFMLFLGIYQLVLFWRTNWPDEARKQQFVVSTGIASLAIIVALVIIALARNNVFGEPDPTAVVAGSTGLAALDRPTQIAIAIGVVGVLAYVIGAVLALLTYGRAIKQFPAFNLLMIFGLFVLPQLTAFPVIALGRNPTEYNLPLWPELLNSDAFVSLIVYMVLLAVSVGLGLWWDQKVFLISAALFYGLYIPLFTTFFTNGGGLLSGPVGSLGYWLQQHEVQRGSQPWYYYLLINLPLYEFLPSLGALLALGIGIYRLLLPRETAEGETQNESARPFPHQLYLAFWGVMSLVAFSIAGEKMPWLTTHITLPFIMLSGWAIGYLTLGFDWQLFLQRQGWLTALVMPIALLAMASLFGSLLGPNRPFAGVELAQLQTTGTFLSALIVTVIAGTGLYLLGNRLGWDNVLRLAALWVFAILGVFTARAAFIASYVNYDAANEFLVYAHGARGVKTVLEQIEDISQRTADGYGLKVAYDDSVAWPMTWYFRDFTNQSYYGSNPTREAVDAPVVIAGPGHWSKVEALLGNRYYRFEYIRMVWPMQDYFNLNWERLSNALSNPEYRQALWDIWYARDYTRYATLTNGNFELSEWPVSERMRLYVRKDVAAEIWDYGVGPTVLESVAEADPCTPFKQTVTASLVWGSEGTGPGQFQSPRDIAVGPDGSVYVADSKNHRIQKFSPTGELLTTFGQFGTAETGNDDPGSFNEPWSVAVGPDGSVYVADTWNHRVQKFDADGKFVTLWGHFGNELTDLTALWGPRSVLVDNLGHVYVTDTGNKRVIVFDESGKPLTTFGTAGSVEPGLFDEPVGLALSPFRELYVADAWNQRLQVYQIPETGSTFTFLREWPIVGWYGQSLENKPYLDTDAKARVYVADPEGYRVLVYAQTGDCAATWGDFGADNTTIGLASGIAVDKDGNVYVSDGGNNRIMKFPPLK